MEANGQTTSINAKLDAPVTPSAAVQNAPHLREDFYGLLKLAEDIQANLREIREKRAKLRFWARVLSHVLIGAALIFGAYLLYLSGDPHFHRLPSAKLWVPYGSLVTAAVSLTFSFTSLVGLIRQIAPMTQDILWEERHLKEIVELLREIEPALAKQEGFSVLERLQMRIRLSRFDIYTDRDDQIAAETAPGLAQPSPARTPRADRELTKPL